MQVSSDNRKLIVLLQSEPQFAVLSLLLPSDDHLLDRLDKTFDLLLASHDDAAAMAFLDVYEAANKALSDSPLNALFELFERTPRSKEGTIRNLPDGTVVWSVHDSPVLLKFKKELLSRIAKSRALEKCECVRFFCSLREGMPEDNQLVMGAVDDAAKTIDKPELCLEALKDCDSCVSKAPRAAVWDALVSRLRERIAISFVKSLPSRKLAVCLAIPAKG